MQADIQRTYVNQPQTPQNRNTNTNLNPGSGAINTTQKKVSNETENQAESYTDVRIKENEMFQNIINRTQNKFIDINHSPGMDDNDSFIEQGMRQQNYGEAPMTEGLDNVILFGLPDPAKVENSRDLLSKSSITEEDYNQLARVGELLLSNLNTIRINDEGIGELVVQLPVVEAE
ncbi:hypothetical protein AKO1_011377 [Acrasis kona]|uniref:Uncharacterized protein n=1 Tax=Acrasis kona TaxID=1008807 RepID=A0AAW2YY67_9EUKA